MTNPCTTPARRCATPDCDPPELTRPLIESLVRAFYADVRADALLGPVFNPLLQGKWSAHLRHMDDFWCTAGRLERSFKGNVYGKHMALSGIQPQHLMRWLQLWRRHTHRALAPKDADKLFGIAVGIARVMHMGWFDVLPERQDLLQQLQLWEAGQAI